MNKQIDTGDRASDRWQAPASRRTWHDNVAYAWQWVVVILIASSLMRLVLQAWEALP